MTPEGPASGYGVGGIDKGILRPPPMMTLFCKSPCSKTACEFTLFGKTLERHTPTRPHAHTPTPVFDVSLEGVVGVSSVKYRRSCTVRSSTRKILTTFRRIPLSPIGQPRSQHANLLESVELFSPHLPPTCSVWPVTLWCLSLYACHTCLCLCACVGAHPQVVTPNPETLRRIVLP